jgi:hypothetical protein
MLFYKITLFKRNADLLGSAFRIRDFLKHLIENVGFLMFWILGERTMVFITSQLFPLYQ